MKDGDIVQDHLQRAHSFEAVLIMWLKGYLCLSPQPTPLCSVTGKTDWLEIDKKSDLRMELPLLVFFQPSCHNLSWTLVFVSRNKN